RLLLHAQELVLVGVADGNRRVMPRLRLAARGLAEVEDRRLTCEPIGLLPSAPGQGLLQHLERPEPRVAGRVECAAFHERLEGPLVRALRIDALGEVPDRREDTALLARTDDGLRRGLPHVLHRGEPEADLALHDREVELRLVHVRWQYLDAHLVARVDVE